MSTNGETVDVQSHAVRYFGTSDVSNNVELYPPYQYPTWYQYPTYTYPQPRIKLTLTEVNRLRAAARKDAKLKEVLAKFGPHIDIEVDFP